MWRPNGLLRRAARQTRDLAFASRFGAVLGVRTSEPYVALTFDDGPHPHWTPAIVELLERHGARATFFCVGESVTRHRDIVEATVRAGHAVGSHTMTHPSLTRLTHAEAADEIEAGHASLSGFNTSLFRPPYGHFNLKVARAAKRLGLTSVLWTAHALDWRRLAAEEMAGRLSSGLRPGAVVLLHDALYTYGPEGEPDRTVLLETLDRVLDEHARTYRFVTVPELLEAGRPVKALVVRDSDDRAEATR